MFNRILLYICLTLLSLPVMAQSEPSEQTPIKWRMTVKMSSPDEGVVTLRAIVSDGWHLYYTELPENGPVPTTFNFADSKGIVFTDSFTPSIEPLEVNDPNFGMELKWWEKNVSFTRKFKLEGTISDAIIEGTVRFMGCNNQTCSPPRTQSFKTTLKPFVANK